MSSLTPTQDRPVTTDATTRSTPLPSAFWGLWAGTVINRTGAMVQPFLAVYLVSAQGFSVSQVGVVMSAFGLGSLGSQAIAGWLADRIGRRTTLVGGMLATSVTMLALGAVSSPPAVAGCAALLGLTIDSYRPASQAIVADLVPRRDRPRAYGVLSWGMNLGYSFAMVGGGWFAQHGPRMMFGVNAAVAVGFAVLVWRCVPETRTTRHTSEGAIGVALRDRLLLAMCAVTFTYGLVYAQVFTTLPLAMSREGISRAPFGLAMALNGALIVALQPFAARWTRRQSPGRALAVGTAVLSAGFAATALVHDARGLAATVAVWTSGEILAAGAGQTIVSNLATADTQGTYAGLSGMSWGAGAALAPLFGTLLMPMGSIALWGGVAVIGMLSAAGGLATGAAAERHCVRRRTRADRLAIPRVR